MLRFLPAQYKGKRKTRGPCPPGAYSLGQTELGGCIDDREESGKQGAEVKTGAERRKTEKPCGEWAGRHAEVPALHGDGGQVWNGVPSRPMADRGEEDRAPVPRRAAACIMHQVLPDLTSQVAAGPSADPAADPVAEGTAGTTGPSASAAAADEPPDAYSQAGQHEQRAQHCADDHAYTLGVCGEK